MNRQADVDEATTLLAVLRHRAEHDAEDLAYNFLVDGEDLELPKSYADLDRDARRIGAMLQAIAKKGARAVLLYPPEIEYVSAFFGCLYAGVVAVPAYPPDPNRLGRTLPRLQAIIADARADIVLTTSMIHGMAQMLFQLAPELEGKTWIATDAPSAAGAEDWKDPAVDASTVAFLQYTSGSTGTPKGVVLTHGNLMHNLGLIARAFEIGPDSIGVSWLPPYHDMGLIGGILAPMYKGRPTALMSPIAFLQRPARWLKAIAKYRATISGGPNFAYELCLRKLPVEDRAALDLSSWKLAFSGAEPVRSDTLARFVEAFAPSGFRERSFYPCYGLAEATLLVSGGALAEEPRRVHVQAESLEANRARFVPPLNPGARTFVSCGRSRDDQRLVAVRPQGELCDEREIGEIWVAGRSVAAGYWERAEESLATFGARLDGEPEAGPFLRTGDLGFLHEGELFITGRLKDLIIVRGRNHYPQDLERSVEECHASVRGGCVAAFGLQVAGEEKVVIALEVERRHHDRRRSGTSPSGGERRGPDRRRSDPPMSMTVDAPRPFEPTELAAAIAHAVATQHDVLVHGVVLLAAGAIPKTSSGKIQRRETRSAVLARSLEEVWRSPVLAGDASEDTPAPSRPDSAPLSEERVLSVRSAARLPWMIDYLREQVGRVLGIPSGDVDLDAPIARLGLDSLQAVELAHELERNLGAILSATSFLKEATLRALAQEVLARLSSTEERVALAARPDAVDELPLSQGQLAMWFLHQLDPGSGAYNVASALTLRSPFDRAMLAEAFERVMMRHHILRSRYLLRDGKPIQRIARHDKVPLDVVDGRSWSEGELSSFLGRKAHHPFDLESGPPFRLHLVERSQSEQVLLLVGHHIVIDMWSLVVLLGEVRRLVESGGEPLPPLRHHYGDFVWWQERFLESAEGKRARSFWLDRLSGPLPPLELPTSRPRPPLQTYRGAVHRTQLSRDLREALRAFGRSRGATLYVALLAAFDVWLWRHTGQEDLLVGSPVAGRSRAGFDELVGYFVNPLVHRADLAGDPSFAEVVSRVRESVLGALEHQDYPFARLVDELHPIRDASRSPIFQVMFGMEKAHVASEDDLALVVLGEPGARANLGPLIIEAAPLEARTAHFDLSLVAWESTGLTLAFQYNADLFDEATMAAMAGRFGRLLETLLQRPDERLSRLDWLEGPERSAVLAAGAGPVATVADSSLAQLFAASVERHPHRLAVVDDEQCLTYQALDRRAERLARELEARGARPGDIVGIAIDRHVDFVVAVVAIWKIGAGYLPLDPASPPSRVRMMLEDAAAVGLVTHRVHQELVGGARTVLFLDELGAEPGVSPTSERGSASPLDPAYVIYTSGSSGVPKGVVVAQRSLVNLLGALRSGVQVYREGTTPLLVSLNGPAVFDTSVKQLVQLLAGHTLRIVPADIRFDGAALLSWLVTSGVDVLDCTPSQLRILMRSGLATAEGAPRTVLVGGEAIDAALWSSLAAVPNVAFYDLYGPTECTVDATLARIEGEEPTIGKPLSNVRVHVVDAALRPVPRGVPGELVIAGVGVARGYLGRPAATADRFVPDPFSESPGSRLYRTGDRARLRADGGLDFLGRVDDQVKIRGYRIEPGEIAVTLSKHQAVREAVVLLRADAGEEPRLIAYVTLQPGASIAPGELRAFALESLPGHMVPAAFVTLGELPLTRNGKLDRAALPVPDASRRDLAASAVAPRTPVEKNLAEIWCQYLRLDEVGVHDNFFELGGDSILAIQIVGRANQAGIALKPQDLFRFQSVAELATVAQSRRSVRGEQGVVVGAVPLTPIQLRFFSPSPIDAHHYNQAVLLELEEGLEPRHLQTALDAIVVHHDALRHRFRGEDDGWEQTCEGSATVPLTCVRLEGATIDERRRERTALFDRLQVGFDLRRGPLFGAAYLESGLERPLLWLAAHHLVIDAVSWRILVRDLWAAYSQVLAGAPPSLPPKTTSFKEWSERVTQLVASGGLDAELPYWEELAARGGDALPRPHGVVLPPVPAAVVRRVSLDEKTTRLLLRDLPGAYRAGVDDALLAALSMACGVLAGTRTLRVEVEGHGREDVVEDVDLSRTVGWFTAIMPVVVEAHPTPREALLAAKSALRAAPRRGIGHGLLRWLGGPARASRVGDAQAEILFNYLGQLGGSLEAPFVLRNDEVGAVRSPRAGRRHLLEVQGAIRGGRLEIDLIHGQSSLAPSFAESLGDQLLRGLEAIAAHASSPDAGGYSPVDFPLARLGAGQLDRLLGRGRDVEDVYPLTPMQQGMLFHALYGDDSTSYLQQFACTLVGPAFRPEVFEAAWQVVLDRHASLRTAFAWRDLADPVQVVRKGVRVAMSREDWSDLPAEVVRARLDAWTRDERSRGFDLSTAPLMRFGLVRTAPEAWRFVWTHHHLVVDGWSVAVIFGEVFEACRAAGGEAAPSRPPVPPFSEYVAWLQRHDVSAARGFWRRELMGITGPTRIGRSGGRFAEEARVEEATLVLSGAATLALRGHAKRHKLTLGVLIQAAWAMVLSRLAAVDDVVFGTPVAGRSAPIAGIEGMVGVFINTIPVRVRVTDETLADWLVRLQDHQVELRTHETASLPDIHGWSDVPREQPMFESLLIVENYPLDESLRDGVEGMRVRAIETFGNTNYPLTIYAMPGEHLELRFLIDRTRFDEVDVRAIVDGMSNVLEALPNGDDRSARSMAATLPVQRLRVTVAATFTTDPVAEPLTFCLDELRIPNRIELAPYNQVFQQLLDPNSLLGANQEGASVIFVRFEDWGGEPSAADFPERVASSTGELLAALEAHRSHNSAPLLVVCCPPSAAVAASFAAAAAEEAARRRIEASGLPWVRVIDLTPEVAAWKVGVVNDDYSDDLGHIPYTEEMFAVAGAIVARGLAGEEVPAVELLVVDGDELCWPVDEDGPLWDAPLDPAGMVAGRALDRLGDRGLRVALTSRGEPRWAGLGLRPSAAGPGRFFRVRIDWSEPDQRVRALAREAGLPLERVAFVSRDLAACAAIRSRAPQVVTIELGEGVDAATVLDRHWSLRGSTIQAVGSPAQVAAGGRAR